MIFSNATKRCFMASVEGISQGSPREMICFVGTWSLRVNTFSTRIRECLMGRRGRGEYSGGRIRGF